jgi:phosphoglycolate phosphatase-like HAD superfamily hydrolase
MTSNIGVVFDFDDTLAPDSTTFLLEEYDIDATEFWHEQFPARVQEGYDPTVAYLTLLLEQIGAKKTMGAATPADLKRCATELEKNLYPGVPDIFDALNEIVAQYEGVAIDYFVVSEGIESLISGSIISDHCTEIYASRLATDGSDVFSGIKRPISFTDKTRYLYEINKGITASEARENPYAVNAEIPEDERKIPFDQMIYIGDGITDIPCFSLIQDRGGRVFGVDEAETTSAKQQAILDLGSPQRAGNLNSPDYTADGQLGSLLRLAVESLCTDSTINQLEAL